MEYGYDEEREHQSDVFLLDVNWDVGDYTLLATASSVTYDMHDWLDPDGGTMAVFADERIETFDPLSVMGSYHRVDIRLAFAPASNAWELALYGRNITDERVRVGGAGNFQSRSSDLVYDAGGATLLRGARWGVQGS